MNSLLSANTDERMRSSLYRETCPQAPDILSDGIRLLTYWIVLNERDQGAADNCALCIVDHFCDMLARGKAKTDSDGAVLALRIRANPVDKAAQMHRQAGARAC